MTVINWRFKRKKKRSKAQSDSLETEKPKGKRWLAVSRLSVQQLDQRFREESVAGILYTTVMGIEPTNITFWDSSVILLHLDIPSHPEDKYYMELCLSEIDIGLLDEVDGVDTPHE